MVLDAVEPDFVLWTFGAVHVLGLMTAWLARVGEGSTWERWAQSFFLLSLVLTGAATVSAPSLGAGYWLASSATLGTMIIMAVCDFRPDRYRSASDVLMN